MTLSLKLLKFKYTHIGEFKMNILQTILGTSWRTTVTGFLTGLVMAYLEYLQSGQQFTWRSVSIVILGYIGGYLQRDNKVSSEEAKNG